MLRRLVLVVIGITTICLCTPPASAGEGAGTFGSVEVDVTLPGGEGGDTGATGGRPDSDGNGSGGSGAEPQADRDTTGNALACVAAATMTGRDPAVVCAADPADPVPAVVVAQLALDRVTFAVPEPHTSPDGHQITGIETWFWLPADQWVSHTARAELPGVWAEVTATPISAAWDPGDDTAPVVCTGPGRPATSGGDTDCGHVYTVIGDYTLTLDVTYEVTWRSSTGETGTFDPIVLTDTAPVEVQQRQAVVN